MSHRLGMNLWASIVVTFSAGVAAVAAPQLAAPAENLPGRTIVREAADPTVGAGELAAREQASWDAEQLRRWVAAETARLEAERAAAAERDRLARAERLAAAKAAKAAADRSRSTPPPTGAGTGDVRTVSSTAYCLTTPTANGGRGYVGSVAMNGVPFGSQWRVQETGRVYTVNDRIGHSSQFDVWMPSCSAARGEYGRRTVTIERVG